MKFGLGDAYSNPVIFLASSDALIAMRDRISRLINEVVNPALFQTRQGVRFQVDRWEHYPAGRVASTVQEKFVERALNSQVAIVLLQDDLRPGTAAELKALLDERLDDPELVILQFAPTSKADAKDLAEITAVLTPYQHKVQWKRPVDLGEPESEKAWTELVRLLIDLVLVVSSQTRGDPVEAR